MKKGKREQKKLAKQMNLPQDRGSNWVGTRPVVFEDKRRKAEEESVNVAIKYYELGSDKEVDY